MLAFFWSLVGTLGKFCAHRLELSLSFFTILPAYPSRITFWECVGVAGEDGRGEDDLAGELHVELIDREE